MNNTQTKIEDDTREGRIYAGEMQLLIEKFKIDLVLKQCCFKGDMIIEIGLITEKLIQLKNWYHTRRSQMESESLKKSIYIKTPEKTSLIEILCKELCDEGHTVDALNLALIDYDELFPLDHQQALNLYELIMDDEIYSLNEIAEGNKKFH